MPTTFPTICDRNPRIRSPPLNFGDAWNRWVAVTQSRQSRGSEPSEPRSEPPEPRSEPRGSDPQSRQSRVRAVRAAGLRAVRAARLWRLHFRAVRAAIQSRGGSFCPSVKSRQSRAALTALKSRRGSGFSEPPEPRVSAALKNGAVRAVRL